MCGEKTHIKMSFECFGNKTCRLCYFKPRNHAKNNIGVLLLAVGKT